MNKSTPSNPFSIYSKNLAFVLIGIFTLLTLHACQNERQNISVTGLSKGLDGYVISLQLNDSTIASENIIKDQFTISTMLPREDFYNLKLSSNGNSKGDHSFLIYLSEGEYLIEIDSASVDKYPGIKSKSTVQKDLTNYYILKEKNMAASEREYITSKKAYDDDFFKSDAKTLDKLIKEFAVAESKLSKSIESSKKDFIAHNTQSTVSAYFLANSFEDMEYKPAPYFILFNALSDNVKESKYGSTAKSLLEKYSKAAVDTPLPKISGVTADGNKFNTEVLKGKLTLVMFWMSSNRDSRNDIKQLMALHKELHPKGLEIVGVAFDSSKERWDRYISDNHLPWIQIHDPEGIKSVNIERFGNSNLPYYFLVGPDLNIIERNPPIGSIPIYHKEYLGKLKTATDL